MFHAAIQISVSSCIDLTMSDFPHFCHFSSLQFCPHLSGTASLGKVSTDSALWTTSILLPIRQPMLLCQITLMDFHVAQLIFQVIGFSSMTSPSPMIQWPALRTLWSQILHTNSKSTHSTLWAKDKQALKLLLSAHQVLIWVICTTCQSNNICMQMIIIGYTTNHTHSQEWYFAKTVHRSKLLSTPSECLTWNSVNQIVPWRLHVLAFNSVQRMVQKHVLVPVNCLYKLTPP